MNKKKILVVDDEQQLVEMLKIRLESEGYVVSGAYDGKEGLKKAKREKFDLIILDVMMPQMSGYAVAAALRTDLNTQDIPIIFFTCLVKKTEAAGLDLSIGGKRNFFLAKPFNSEDLLAKVRSALGEKSEKTK